LVFAEDTRNHTMQQRKREFAYVVKKFKNTFKGKLDIKHSTSFAWLQIVDISNQSAEFKIAPDEIYNSVDWGDCKIAYQGETLEIISVTNP